MGNLHLMSQAHDAQSFMKNSFFIEPKVRFGPILEIYPDLPERNLTFSGEVNLAWQTTGKKYWHQPYKFPQVGLIVAYSSFGNDDILGHELSLVPNLTYQFTNFGKFTLTGSVGIGFAYFNKPFHRINNPENKLIGSILTNKTLLALNLDYIINTNLHLTGGVSYLHYSNGHNQLPNIGINIPAIQVGLKYFTKGFPENFYKSDSIPDFCKKWLFNIRLGLGSHEFGDPVKPDGGPKYPIYNLSFYLSKRLGAVTNFHAGIHLNYYTSFYDFIIFQEFYSEKQRQKSITAIGFAGVEFLIGHISFTGQMGLLLYNPFYRDLQQLNGTTDGFNNAAKRVLSFKFGVQYYAFETSRTTRFNPWLGLFIKSNAGQADFLEISIGCAF